MTEPTAPVPALPVKPRGRPFAAGNPGKPRGAKSKSTQFVEAFVSKNPDAIKDIVNTTIQAARSGKPWACELILDRLWPVPRDRRVEFELPLLNTLQDVKDAIGAVTQAIAAGKLTISEGEAMASLISKFAQPVIEEADLEARILALERDKR